MSKYENELLGRLFGQSRSKPIATAAVIISICVAGWDAPAWAYRPFDGTDAAVADVGEVEIEFQPIGAIRAVQQRGYPMPSSTTALRIDGN